MARLIEISNTSWKQLFQDRERQYQYWSIPKNIADHCQIKDGDDKKIRIHFPEIDFSDITEIFHITSGKEISFRKNIQNIIGPIVKQNRSSYYIAEILDLEELSTPRPSDYDEPKIPDRIKLETYRILRDTKLAREMKEIHKNKCQICGYQIPLLNERFYSEAHHIKPLGNIHNGPDVPENIIVVCPNHHSMLDYFSIKIDLNKIYIHSKHKIGNEYIEYHNEQFEKNANQPIHSDGNSDTPRSSR